MAKYLSAAAPVKGEGGGERRKSWPRRDLGGRRMFFPLIGDEDKASGGSQLFFLFENAKEGATFSLFFSRTGKTAGAATSSINAAALR